MSIGKINQVIGCYHHEALMNTLVSSLRWLWLRLILEVPGGAEDIELHQKHNFKEIVVDKESSNHDVDKESEQKVRKIKHYETL